MTVQGRESDWFEIKTGVRQKDVLSPLLIIIFIDKSLRDIRTGITNEETVMYADDVVVLLTLCVLIYINISHLLPSNINSMNITCPFPYCP